MSTQILPLIQLAIPKQQNDFERLGLPQLQPTSNVLQADGTVPDYVNSNMPIEQKRALLANQNYTGLQQIPQQPITDVSPQANAGAIGNGVDWRGVLGTLGSYLRAAGEGMGNAPNWQQGLAGASQGMAQNQQNIRNYQAMSPYFKEMGINTQYLDPRRGGAGIATTPEKMVDLQSKITERDYLNDYRQTLAQARAAQAAQTAGTKGVTIGTLRMMSPQFKKMIDAQYGFSNGQNLKLLDQVVPASMVQGYMPAVTKISNMVYSGGLHSSQSKTGRSDIYHHSNGGSGGGRSSKGKKLIF